MKEEAGMLLLFLCGGHPPSPSKEGSGRWIAEEGRGGGSNAPGKWKEGTERRDNRRGGLALADWDGAQYVHVAGRR